MTENTRPSQSMIDLGCIAGVGVMLAVLVLGWILGIVR